MSQHQTATYAFSETEAAPPASTARPEYTAWIQQETAGRDVTGLCKVYSEMMAKQFPELKIIEGSVETGYGYICGHFWLEDEHGSIIDPTAQQFDTLGGVMRYSRRVLE
jgi:hypothetical protein